MATQTISLFPRIARVLQAGDNLIADVIQPNGSVVTMRVDASDLFGGVAAALETLALVIKGLTVPTIALDGIASIATDGKGNVTHTAASIILAGQVSGPDLVDITSSGSPEPAAGSRLLFIDGGFVKCAT